MRFTLTGRRVSLTPALKEYAEKKLARRIERFAARSNILEALVLSIEVSRETLHHKKGKIWKAAATIALPQYKQPLYAQATDEDVHAAIDLLAEEIEREILKYKGRLRSLMLRGARALKRIVRFNRWARSRPRDRVREEGS